MWRDFRRSLAWWEKQLHKLRQNLEVQSEAESEDSEEELEGEENNLAQSVRVMDVGVVKSGEPEIFMPQRGRQDLKRFLSRKKQSE